MSDLVDLDGASEMELNLKYRGEPVREGRMSARELGPALFGMAEVLERTAAVVYGDGSALRVDVQGNFKHGSFVVNFVATASPDSLVPNLTWEELSYVAAVLGLGYLVGKDVTVGAFKSVLALIRWQRGRKVEKVEPAEEPGTVKITLSGGDNSVVSLQLFNIWADKGVRSGLQNVTDPLRSPGMEALEIGPPGEDPIVIPREEARWFVASAGPGTEDEPEEFTAYLDVIGPNFRTGKWRFGAAGLAFHASIEDAEFLRKVHRKEYRFAEGDVLKVRMRLQSQGARGEPVRTIVEVLEHIPALPPSDQMEHG